MSRVDAVRPTVAVRPLSLAGVAFVLVSAAGFSLQGLFAKLAYEGHASTTTVGLGRWALATLVLWAYSLWRHKRNGEPLRLARASTLTLLGLGGIGYFLGSLTYLLAVTRIPVSLAGLLLYTYPAIATLFAAAAGRERVTSGLSLGLLVTLLGVAVTLGLPALTSAGQADALGLALVLGSAVLYALYIVVSDRSMAGIPTMLAMAYIASGATASFAVLTLITRSFTPGVGAGAWAAIAAMALISTVLAAGGFLAGLRRLGPARAATLSTVEPLFTVVFAAIVLGERLTPLQLGGGLVILLGVLIVIRERAPEAAPPPA
jgi:drug/metabolite transporter (DMT)-like permease